MEVWHIVLLFAVRLSLSAAVLWLVFHYMGMIPFLLEVG